MLSTAEFGDWCNRSSIREVTRQIIEVERMSEPSRRVKGGRGNWRGFYISPKMKRTIQFESGNELAQIKSGLENNDNVLEYYCQPRAIGLKYLDRSERLYKCQHTPDFFVIREDGAGWVECKTEEDLIRLSQESPNRYVQRQDGSWSCPPGEKYAQERGLFYEFWSSADINPLLIRNIDRLKDYFTNPPPSIDVETAKQILELVEANLGVTYAEVLKSIEGINPDHINILIVAEKVYVDLEAAPLGRPDKVHTFLNSTMAFAYAQTRKIEPILVPEDFQIIRVDVGNSISWDGQHWEIYNLGVERISLVNQDGQLKDLLNREFDKYIQDGKIIAVQVELEPITSQKSIEIFQQARPEDHLKAQERLAAIKPWLGDDPPPYPPRSIRRWRAAYRDAEIHYASGYLGLLPQQSGKNSQPRIDPAITEFTHEFLKTHHENTKMRRPKGLYRQYRVDCTEHDPPFQPPSEKWFALQIKKRTGYAQALAREGSRAAKQQKLFRMDTGTPRYGELPWQDVQIDHTQIPLRCISSLLSLDTCNTSSAIRLNDIVLGNPWVTLAISTSCRRLLAVYLSFESPSARSCLMILRILVKRYKRLAQRFTFDNGSEFDSIDFHSALAYYHCDKRHRPAGEPRFGAPIERVIGTTQQQFTDELLGQTRLMRDPRMMTKSVDPNGQAVWTLEEVFAGLEQWAYDIYDNRLHSSLGASPRQAYEMGIALGGPREIRRLEYGETFKIITTPTPKRGKPTRIVQPNGRGVKIDYFYYWCAAFEDPEIVGKPVLVKREPFHPGFAYAFVKGRWQECISPYADFLNGYTEREIRLIAEDLRQRKALPGKKTEISDVELVEFMKSSEALEGNLLKQRLRALENKAVVDRIEQGKSSQSAHFASNEFANLTDKNDDPEASSDESQQHDGADDANESNDLEDLEYFGAF